LATGLVFAPYSREQEREADRLGQQIAASAGWDPAALSRALYTLEREEALQPQGTRRPSFLDTHPATPERVANTTEYAKTLTRAARATTALSAAEFLKHLDGLVVGAGAAAGVVDGQDFLHPDLNLFLRFPVDWRVQNGRAQIASAPPDGSAVILLQVVESGNDPLSGARALEKAAGTSLSSRAERFTVNELPAARTRVSADADQGKVGIDFVWIAHGGHVFQIAGITALRRIEQYGPTFDTVAKSFRPLQPTERAGITETRLRLINGRPGEQLSALAARGKSSWSAEMLAIANGLDASQPLEGDQLIKVAVAEPYRGAGKTTTP